MELGAISASFHPLNSSNMSDDVVTMKASTASDEKQSIVGETNHEPPPWTTTRNELWAYYLYYVGNNGLSAFNFGPSQFQNLLFLAGYDPTEAPFSVPCGDNGCVLPYLGAVRDSMFCMSICY